MLTKRSAQEDILNSDNQYLEFVGKNTFYGYLAAHRHEIFRDEDFAMLYCENNGRGSVPPSLLATALLLQWHDGTSDEETVNRVKYDLRWKVALGLKMEEVPFVKSTLWLFRTQLIVRGEALKIFKESLRHAREDGYFKSRKIKVILDTTPIIGKGAVEDTYNLLAESLREVLGILAKLEEKEFGVFASDHDFGRYAERSFKGSVSIDWDNEEERQVVLNSLVSDCDRVLVLAGEKLWGYSSESDEAKEIIDATDLLSKILAQDVKRSNEGKAEIIEGVARDRIVSVHDPEMRHGRKSSSKRFDGYKGAIGVDAESQIVTAVDVLPGNAHDSTDAEEITKETEKNTDSEVETVIGDGAYGTVEQRIEAEEAGRVLVSPVPKAPDTGRFTKEDFVVDVEKDTVICPAGKITGEFIKNKQTTKRGNVFHNRVFQFPVEECRKCPLMEHCVKPGAKRRSVSVHEHEKLLQKARQFQRTEEFRKLYHPRSTVEHRLARLVQLGLRKARYFGSKKVLFQLAMVAAVANFTLVAARAANLPPFFSALIYVSVILAATTSLSSTASQWRLSLRTPPVQPTAAAFAFTNTGFRPGF